MRPKTLDTLSAALLLALALPMGAARAQASDDEAPSQSAGQPQLYYYCTAGLGTSSRFYVTPIMPETWHYDPLGIVLKQPVNYAWKQAVSTASLANNPHCEYGTKEDAKLQRQTQIELAVHFNHQVINMDWRYGQTGPATMVADKKPAPDVKTAGDAKTPKVVDAQLMPDLSSLLRH